MIDDIRQDIQAIDIQARTRALERLEQLLGDKSISKLEYSTRYLAIHYTHQQPGAA